MAEGVAAMVKIVSGGCPTPFGACPDDPGALCGESIEFLNGFRDVSGSTAPGPARYVRLKVGRAVPCQSDAHRGVVYPGNGLKTGEGYVRSSATQSRRV